MSKKRYIEYEDGTRVELGPDDAPELDEAWFKKARPAREMLPPAFLKAMKEGRVGRPPAQNPKQPVTLRLDADLLAALRATGKGWQTRANDALRSWMDLRT